MLINVSRIDSVWGDIPGSGSSGSNLLSFVASSYLGTATTEILSELT